MSLERHMFSHGHDDQPDAGQPPRPKTNQPASPHWPTWALLALFVFLSLECMLLAFALKGPWFVLAAPGVVCGIKAWDTWRGLRRK